jgi:hypothetical protein
MPGYLIQRLTENPDIGLHFDTEVVADCMAGQETKAKSLATVFNIFLAALVSEILRCRC